MMNPNVQISDWLDLNFAPPTADTIPERTRRGRGRPRAHKYGTIPNPPFPWATNIRAKVHTLDHLRNNGIVAIQGEFQCKNCEFRERRSYKVQSCFEEMVQFLVARHHEMYNKIPAEWKKRDSADCSLCNQKGSMKPVISAKKRSINWLFLFLGKAIHLCTLRQLKYFCKHNNIFRSGCKESLLFAAYMAIFHQLQPGLFD